MPLLPADIEKIEKECKYQYHLNSHYFRIHYNMRLNDLIQECVIECINRLNKDQPKSIRKWCKWKSYEILRQRKRAKRLQRTESPTEIINNEGHVTYIFDTLEHPPEDTSLQEAKEILESCFKNYPRATKLCFLLKLEYLTNRQIAKVLSVCESRVHQILRQNEPILLKYLEEQNERN